MWPRVFTVAHDVDLPWIGKTDLFLPSYGLLFATATVVAWFWFMRRARSIDAPPETIFNLAFYTVIAGLLGAKLTLVLVDWEYYLENPSQILGTLRSAGVVIGGLVIGGIVFVGYARRHGLPIARVADAAAAPAALGQAIGRLGCFASGCCYGVPVAPDHPLAVVFEHPATHGPLGRPVLAVQLIEFASNLAIALVLTFLWRRRPRAGVTIWTYVVLYATTRGAIEFLRGDGARGLYFDGAISTSQILSAVALVVGLAALVRTVRRRDEAGAA